MALPAAILEAGLPVDRDLGIARGDSPRIRLTVKSAATRAVVPLDGVTGCTLVITAADGKAALITKAGTIETPTSLGQIYFDLTMAETTSLQFPAQDDDQVQDTVTSHRWWASLEANLQRRIIARGRILLFAPLDA